MNDLKLNDDEEELSCDGCGDVNFRYEHFSYVLHRDIPPKMNHF